MSGFSLKREALATIICLTVCPAVDAQDRLVSGPGSTLTENKCGICHELEHIKRARLSRGEWADNVRNMRERGAPITDDEMTVIVEYLATYYNRDKPAPAPSADKLAAATGDPVQRLLDAHACNGCHALDRPIVGPSFREVAAKYAGDAGAASRLAAKIRDGGKGVWGQVPMPPNASVPDADLRAIVDWVLARR